MAQDRISNYRPLPFSLVRQPSSQGGKPLGIWAGIGFLADTANDTVFTMSFQGDYSVNSEFSIGPQLLITPGGDLTQISLS